MRKAVVLVSGGIDSLVALDWARERFRTIALSFDVAGRPRREAKACAAIIFESFRPYLPTFFCNDAKKRSYY